MIRSTSYRFLLLAVTTSVVCAGQAQTQERYQVGNVMAAQVHEATAGEDSKVLRYDVTLHIGNTEYVVLYTPPNGQRTVEYHLGRDSSFLVQKDTIVFHNMLGERQEVPILSRRPIAAKAKPK